MCVCLLRDSVSRNPRELQLFLFLHNTEEALKYSLLSVQQNLILEFLRRKDAVFLCDVAGQDFTGRSIDSDGGDDDDDDGDVDDDDADNDCAAELDDDENETSPPESPLSLCNA